MLEASLDLVGHSQREGHRLLSGQGGSWVVAEPLLCQAEPGTGVHTTAPGFPGGRLRIGQGVVWEQGGLGGHLKEIRSWALTQ